MELSQEREEEREMEEGWNEGVVKMKMKLKGGRGMNTVEEVGGRDERRHMQRRVLEIKGDGEFGRKGKMEDG